MKRRLIFEILLVIVVLIIAIVKWTSDKNDTELIDKNSKATAGLVYELNSTFPQNTHVKYKYIVRNQYYSSKTQVETTVRHCNVDTNDKFRVEYSLSNPSTSRLVLQCKLPDTTTLGTTLNDSDCVDCY